MSLVNVFTIWLTPALQKYMLYLLGISLACSENICVLSMYLSWCIVHKQRFIKTGTASICSTKCWHQHYRWSAHFIATHTSCAQHYLTEYSDLYIHWSLIMHVQYCTMLSFVFLSFLLIAQHVTTWRLQHDSFSRCAQLILAPSVGYTSHSMGCLYLGNQIQVHCYRNVHLQKCKNKW